VGSQAGAGGPAVPTHPSPLFQIDAQESVTLGYEATVIALRKLPQTDPAGASSITAIPDA
jgi:hypothetical protein